MLNLRRRVTNRVLDMLERYERPWRLEHRPDRNCGQPRNARTNGLYRGVNPILLNSAAQRHGLYSRWWGTKADWRHLGAAVQDNALGVTVCVYPKDDGLLGLSEETIFNAAHVARADRYQVLVTETHSYEQADFKTASLTIVSPKADIRIGIDDENNPPTYCGYIYPQPYKLWPHHAKGDYILVPKGSERVHEFFCNVFHELIHWSEIRTHYSDFLDSMELVADMGSFLLAQECGIPPDEASYHYMHWREKWINRLDDEDTVIFRVAAQAGRATDHVLSYSQPRRTDKHYHDPDTMTILPYFPGKVEQQ